MNAITTAAKNTPNAPISETLKPPIPLAKANIRARTQKLSNEAARETTACQAALFKSSGSVTH